MSVQCVDLSTTLKHGECTCRWHEELENNYAKQAMLGKWLQRAMGIGLADTLDDADKDSGKILLVLMGKSCSK